MLSGLVTLNIKGFGFDSKGYLYIGKEMSIEKYLGNSLVEKIYPHTSRDYSFSLQDDIIYLSNIEDVYELDLAGNVITQHEDLHGKAFVELQEITEVTDSFGTSYKLMNSFGREYIESETGEIIYKMPVWQYFIKLLLYLEIPLVLVFGILIVIKYRKVRNV